MEKVIVKASNKTQGKEKYDLYIGRWQPWHDGHQWLIYQSLKKGRNVCIAIRDVPKDDKNWWDAHDIADNLVARFHKEVKEGKIKVTVIPDIDSIHIGRDVGYDIIEHTPPSQIGEISGTKIREQLKQQEQ
jgi:hypothetical protein